MRTLREALEYDAWDDARDLGILPPQLDFVTADLMEAERQEEDRERNQPRQAQRTRTP